MPTIQEQIEYARTLLDEGRAYDAIRVVAGVLQQNRSDANAWWLLATATSKRDEARRALQHVVRLRPDDERARRMLAKVVASSVSLAQIQAEAYKESGQLKIVTCCDCGACIQIYQEVEQCAFCGSTGLLLAEEKQAEDIKARELIPFTISYLDCPQIFTDWLGESWFTAGSLRRAAGAFQAVYVPFWTLDADVRGTCRIIENEVVREEPIYTRIESLMFPATERLQKVGRYNVSHAIPYTLVDAASVPVLEPESKGYEALHNAYTAVQAQVYDDFERRIDVKDASVEVLPNFQNEDWRIVMAPLYIAVYRLRGRVYTIVINGQTGIVTGQKSIDWLKVGGMLATLLVLAAAFFAAAGVVEGMSLAAGFVFLGVMCIWGGLMVVHAVASL